MNFYFLITSATSALVFGSQWYNSHSCRGYPQSMHVFYTADLTDCQQPETETWPSMYKTYCPVYPYDFCGNVNVDFAPKQCCVDSLDVELSDGYTSAVMVEIENEELILSYALKECNGGTFCSIKPISSSDALGYHSVYLLNDGSCHDSQLKCSGNSLMVYPEAECQGTPVVYSLNSSSAIAQDLVLGNITASIVTFNQGTSSIGWVTGLPSEKLIPALRNGW
jgi:hypothetical protein